MPSDLKAENGFYSLTENARKKAFLLLVLACMGVLFLAAGLPDMQFSQGLPLPGAVEGQTPLAERTTRADPAPEGDLYLWAQAVLAFGLLLLLSCLVYLIVVPKYRAWLRPVLIALGLVVVMGCLAAFLRPAPGEHSASAADQIIHAPSLTFNTSPLGDPPAWLLWLVVASSLILVIVLGVWLFRQSFTQKPKKSPMVQEAEKALADLKAGSDLSDVIVRCYLRMNQAIQEERGLAREEILTPREFEMFLVAEGVPVEPLRALTRLFEAVRYGRKPADQQAEETAVACLSAIIRYCQMGTARS